MVHAPLPCRPNTVLVTFFGQARLCRRSLHRDKNQYSTFLYFKQLGDLGTACSIIWHHIWVGKFSWPSINWLHSWKMYILQHVPMFHVCWLAPTATHYMRQSYRWSWNMNYIHTKHKIYSSTFYNMTQYRTIAAQFAVRLEWCKTTVSAAVDE